MKYILTIKFTDGSTQTVQLGTFCQLSRAIDLAWKLPGFCGYVVGPAS